jgi:hypothetical protein
VLTSLLIQIKINIALAMPIANPRILITDVPLLRRNLRNVIFKKLLSMGRIFDLSTTKGPKSFLIVA